MQDEILRTLDNRIPDVFGNSNLISHLQNTDQPVPNAGLVTDAAACKSSRCVKIDNTDARAGAGEYLKITPMRMGQGDGITVSMWFRRGDAAGNDEMRLFTFASSSNTASDDGEVLIGKINSPNPNKFEIEIKESSAAAAAPDPGVRRYAPLRRAPGGGGRGGGGGGGGGGGDKAVAGTQAAAEWVHLTVTISKGATDVTNIMTLYQNGDQTSQISDAYFPKDLTYDFILLGASTVKGTKGFVGHIDSFHVWSTVALSSDQAKLVFDDGIKHGFTILFNQPEVSFRSDQLCSALSSPSSPVKNSTTPLHCLRLSRPVPLRGCGFEQILSKYIEQIHATNSWHIHLLPNLFHHKASLSPRPWIL